MCSHRRDMEQTFGRGMKTTLKVAGARLLLHCLLSRQRLRTLNKISHMIPLPMNCHWRLMGRRESHRTRCTMKKNGRNRNTVTVGKKLGKLEFEARFVPGKIRRGSSLTRKDVLNCLGNIGRRMQHFGLNSIRDMKPSHVCRYFAELRDKGLSAGRMANHATAMRLLCRMMGKPEIVPSNRVLGCARDIVNRTKHADERVNHEKVAEVRAQLSENSRIAYDMARHFGLRQKETLLSYRIIDRNGVEYLNVEGAKGCRQREIPITDKQRAVLRQNHEYRAENGGKLIDADKSLEQGMKRLQNELAKAGATRSSGANMHALRREWIIERCQEIKSAPEHADGPGRTSRSRPH